MGILRKGWKGIVKIQRPLSTTADEPQLLLYSESHDLLQQLPLPSEEGLEKIFGEDYKAYWKAKIVRDKGGKFNLYLLKRVGEQDW